MPKLLFFRSHSFRYMGIWGFWFSKEKKEVLKWEKKAKSDDKDLINADLHGADLEFADLKNKNLMGANFADANLYGADFSGAHLIDTNFGGTDTRHAYGLG